MAYLTIAGNDLDSKVQINSISCTHGRTDITQQPSPSTFRCTFEVNDGTALTYPIVVGAQIVWQLYDSTGYDSKRIVFLGTVSDVQVSLNWANGTGIYIYSITGVDGLAQLNNAFVGGSGFVKDYDGNRIKAIMQEWSSGIDVSGITTPGSYEIAVYSGGKTNALTLMQEAANSANGVLYCQPNSAGRIRYQSYTSRTSNPIIVLANSEVLASDYVLTQSTNSVANRVSLTYGTGSSGTVYNDTTSQTTYGIREGVRDTTLHNSSDANSIAQIILAARKAPQYKLTSLTVSTALVSDALRTSLVNIEIGTQIEISGLPTPEANSFYGFIEGYTWTTSRGQDIIQMNLSSYGELYPYTLWSDLNATDTWNTYATATTAWSDLI